VIGLLSTEAGELKVKIEPPLGVTENPRSAIAASKLVHATEPCASDRENKVAKSLLSKINSPSERGMMTDSAPGNANGKLPPGYE
jgi:hypothetical protein